jgi:hypothetical protein
MAVDYKIPPLEAHHPEFRKGFEMGLLWSVLAGPAEDDERPSYVLHRENSEMAEAIAMVTGWRVVFSRADEPGWLTASFSRVRRRLTIVRPDGEG